MGPKFITALPTAHGIGRATAVELRPSFSQTQQRRCTCRKCQNSRIFTVAEFLNRLAVLVSDCDADGMPGDREPKIPGCNLPRRFLRNRSSWTTPGLLHQRSVRRNLSLRFFFEDGQSQGVFIDSGNLKLRW